MKVDLIELLACPVCQRFPLEMKVHHRRDEEIIEADLTCGSCKKTYPVKDRIPVMLPDLRERGILDSSDSKLTSLLDHKSYEKHKEIREANIIYYDSVAEVYEDEVEQAVHQSDFNQRRMDRIIRNVAEKTQKDLFLDLGCGTGNVLKFGNKYFRKAIGIDVSFNMLKRAKQNNLEVIQADIMFLPFKPSLFDVVSIFSVLHHLYDYQKVFTQVSRVLKKGGFLYSDWDPTKKPLPDPQKISWRLYQLMEKAPFPPLRLAKRRLKVVLKRGNDHKTSMDFLKIRPELKEINAKAEFHNLRREPERGIDFERVKRSLMENGFTNIQPTFHWEGKSLAQLPLSLKMKFFFLRFQDQPLENFLENLMIVSQKSEP